ncbi:hypothetical protein WE348_21100 (plasmid) [Alteromonas macleodii]|uniref:hypothetical protein n=1 Tax=Alteromonas macleodii TaxID=28108 RepID=UPI0030D1B20D
MFKFFSTFLLLTCLSFSASGITYYAGHFGEPRDYESVYKTEFGQRLLIKNTLLAIKFGDALAIKRNVEAGLNSFLINTHGLSFIDVFISISKANKNQFGESLAQYTVSLIESGMADLVLALDAALPNRSAIFEKLIMKNSFYLYTHLNPGKPFGYLVAKSGCGKCVDILLANNYNRLLLSSKRPKE